MEFKDKFFIGYLGNKIVTEFIFPFCINKELNIISSKICVPLKLHAA